MQLAVYSTHARDALLPVGGHVEIIRCVEHLKSLRMRGCVRSRLCRAVPAHVVLP